MGLPMPQGSLFMVNCTCMYVRAYMCEFCFCVAVWSCWSTQHTVTVACCLGLIFIDKL